MPVHEATLTIETRGRGSVDVTALVERAVGEAGIGTGLCLDLGTWQGLYLLEHRRAGQRRRVSVTLTGEPA